MQCFAPHIITALHLDFLGDMLDFPTMKHPDFSHAFNRCTEKCWCKQSNINTGSIWIKQHYLGLSFKREMMGVIDDND